MALVYKRRGNSEACKPLCIKQFIMQSVLVVCVLSLAALASLANGNYFYLYFFSHLNLNLTLRLLLYLSPVTEKRI